jgi:hypothetical protein
MTRRNSYRRRSSGRRRSPRRSQVYQNDYAAPVASPWGLGVDQLSAMQLMCQNGTLQTRSGFQLVKKDEDSEYKKKFEASEKEKLEQKEKQAAEYKRQCEALGVRLQKIKNHMPSIAAAYQKVDQGAGIDSRDATMFNELDLPPPIKVNPTHMTIPLPPSAHNKDDVVFDCKTQSWWKKTVSGETTTITKI